MKYYGKGPKYYQQAFGCCFVQKEIPPPPRRKCSSLVTQHRITINSLGWHEMHISRFG